MRIYRSEGSRAFYRGLIPSLLGIAHVAVQFPLYEQLKIIARTLHPTTFFFFFFYVHATFGKLTVHVVSPSPPPPRRTS
jgi:putative effector of murein hydrolase